MWSIILLSLLLTIVLALNTHYEDQSVIECTYHCNAQLKSILPIVLAIEADDHGDLWNEHIDEERGTLLFRVDPDGLKAINDSVFIDEGGCRVVGTVADLAAKSSSIASNETPLDKAFEGQNVLHEHSANPITQSADNPSKSCKFGPFYDDYRSFAEIQARLLDLQKQFPSIVQIVQYGNSIEGRPLYAVHLNPQGTKKVAKNLYHVEDVEKTVWIQGGIHAREWISPAAVMYLLDTLAHGISTNDSAMTSSLQGYKLVIAPCVNPDGYEYSRQHDRMWRKNRSLNPDGTRGTDLNRNFDNFWAVHGASTKGKSSYTKTDLLDTHILI